MDCKEMARNGNNDRNGPHKIADVIDCPHFERSECLNVGNIQIKDSSKVHIGPKIISINHDVTGNTLKAKLVGWSWCCARVAFCSCWASFLVCCVILIVFRVLPSPQIQRLDLGIIEKWFINRRDWQAMPSYDAQYLSNPVNTVVFGHSAKSYCNEKYKCINEVLNIQQDHLRRGYSDIGPNYLVGGNGFVFEGRGANIHGAMVQNWNNKIISIMFLGDYQVCTLDNEQIENVKILLQTLVQKDMLSVDYEIFGHCQLSSYIISPGQNIWSETSSFEHWVSKNVSMCLQNKSFSNQKCT